MRIVAIVLAAGEGRRIGGPKALLPIGGGTFLARVCELFARTAIDRVVAVLGAEADRVRSRVGLPAAVQAVVNQGWRSGMLSSVWCGLDAAEALSADAVLLHPVDHPLVGVAAIDRVCAALQAGAAIVVPTWDGRRGHPGGFARPVFAEIRGVSPSQGARAVVAARPERVVHVEGDPGCVRGIDEPADLAAVARFSAGGLRG